jgi:hypothetical protein
VDSQSGQVVPAKNNGLSFTGFLLVLGLVLLAVGFAIIAVATLTEVLHPASFFLYAGVAAFVAGAISIGCAWRMLS